MSFTVKLYNFNKKENSTKVVDTSSTNFECTLKDACSVISPVLKFNFDGGATYNPITFNYAKIDAFNRYYFITNWTWSAGVWVASLQIDVLATYKSDFLEMNLYVTRCNTVQSANVVDSKYPTLAKKIDQVAYSTTSPFHENSMYGIGCYIVGVINNSSKAGVTYYGLSANAYNNLCAGIFQNIDWSGISASTLDTGVQKALINPFQYIVSVLYLPIQMSTIVSTWSLTQITTIPFGWWSVTLTGGNYAYEVRDNMYMTYNLTVGIPKHPDLYRGNWLQLSPYSNYTLRYYPFGTIDIDSRFLLGCTTLYLYTNVDIVTGQAILNIGCGSAGDGIDPFANPIRTMQTNLGIYKPTASINVDYSNYKSGVVSAVSSGVSTVATSIAKSEKVQGWLAKTWNNVKSAFSGKFDQIQIGGENTIVDAVSDINIDTVAEDVTSAASDIGETALAAMSTVECNSQQGTASLYTTQSIVLSGKFTHVANEDVYNNGRPLCQMKRMRNLISESSGNQYANSIYILTNDSNITLTNATVSEVTIFRRYLLQGMFIE